jgi:hypothetical protein
LLDQLIGHEIPLRKWWYYSPEFNNSITIGFNNYGMLRGEYTIGEYWGARVTIGNLGDVDYFKLLEKDLSFWA